MATSFYGAEFFGGEFFFGSTPPPTPTASTGGGGGWYGKHSYKRKRFDQQIAELIDKDVREAYVALTKPSMPQEVRAEAAGLVSDFTKSRKDVPPAERIDWSALREETKVVREILALWAYEMEMTAVLDDDDEIALL